MSQKNQQMVQKIKQLQELKDLKKMLKAEKTQKNSSFNNPTQNPSYNYGTEINKLYENMRFRTYGGIKNPIFHDEISQYPQEIPYNTNTNTPHFNPDNAFLHPPPLYSPFLFPPRNCGHPLNQEIDRNKKTLKIVKNRINSLKSELENETQNGRVIGGCVNGEMFSGGVANGGFIDRLNMGDFTNSGMNGGKIWGRKMDGSGGMGGGSGIFGRGGGLENALYDTLTTERLKEMKMQLDERIVGLDDEIVEDHGLFKKFPEQHGDDEEDDDGDEEDEYDEDDEEEDDDDNDNESDMMSENEDDGVRLDYEDGGDLRLKKKYKKMKKAYKLSKNKTKNQKTNSKTPNDFKFLNESVNNSQRDSVRFKKHPQIFNPGSKFPYGSKLNYLGDNSASKLNYMGDKRSMMQYNVKEGSDGTLDMVPSLKNSPIISELQGLIPALRASKRSSGSGKKRSSNKSFGSKKKGKKSKKCQFCLCFPKKKDKQKEFEKWTQQCCDCCCPNFCNPCCCRPGFCNKFCGCCKPCCCNPCCRGCCCGKCCGQSGISFGGLEKEQKMKLLNLLLKKMSGLPE